MHLAHKNERLVVSKELKERIHKIGIPLLKRRNPDLSNIDITENFYISWIQERYEKNEGLQ
jgi:hypothetical protein